MKFEMDYKKALRFLIFWSKLNLSEKIEIKKSFILSLMDWFT